MTTVTVSAERTVTLTRPHLLNPLRRLLRRPVPTYTAHLFADAVVAADDTPTLSLEDVDGRGVCVVFTWPGRTLGGVTRLSVRERGADRFLSNVRARHDFPKAELEDRVHAAVTAGHMTPNGGRKVLAGEKSFAEATGEAFATLSERDEARSAPEPVEVALPRRVAAMWAEGAMPSGFPGDPTPPTQSTTVLHDLVFIADQLETAQFQIAFTPGGADAGSTGNAAHLALCALQLVQAKLDVAADAGVALGDTIQSALDALPTHGTTTGLEGEARQRQDSLNRARRMMLAAQRQAALLPKPESAHVVF